MPLRTIAAIALAAGSLALSGCSARPAALRIVIADWPPDEFLHLAREKGFFAAEGVDVQLVEFNFPSDQQRAFEHQSVDGGVLSIFEVLRARDRSDRNLQIALVVDFSNGADAILAAGDITDVAGLRGKKVGIDGGALSYYILARGLELHNMTLADVSVVPMHAVQMADALNTGLIDAAVTYPPARTNIEDQVPVRTIFTSSEIPGEIVDVLALDSKVLQDRPADAERLVRAFYRAVAYAASHPDEALAVMAQREHMSVANFSRALRDGLTLVGLPDQQRFMGPTSQLPAVMSAAEAIMRSSGQLVGPRRSLPALVLDPTLAANQQ